MSHSVEVGGSTMPQTTRDQQRLGGERKTETTPMSRAVPCNNTNRAEQKGRVTEVYDPDDSEKVDTDGIYDVPSSVLRSIDTVMEEQESEYDQLIPASALRAKMADESQTITPSQLGRGYAEIKDVGPSAPAATIQVVTSHQDNSFSRSQLQYADITDTFPSKQAPVIKQAAYTHNMDSTIDVHGSLTASLTPQSWDGAITKEDYIEEQVVQASVINIDNVQHMERESPACHELEQSSEISEPEDSRNMVTPEGSEGSDVFIEQSPISTTTKSNSLPPRVSYQTQSIGGGNAISTQRGTSMKIPSPRHNRPRIVSEPQPTTKPRPAKRTRVSNDPPPPALPERTFPQLSETPPLADSWASQPELPPPALPEKPQPPPPVLPEKPLPVLPEKPIPTLPEEIVPVLPEKPVPVLPEKPLPELPDKPPPPLPDKPPPVLPEKPSPPLPHKPPPVLPDKPPLELPEKPLPVLPEKPVWEKPAAPPPPLEQPVNVADRFDSPAVGKSPPKVLERPPVPKPRRHFQSTSGSTPVQVRSSRSHTTATCNTEGLDSSPMPPSTYRSQETNGGSPKAFRSTRAKSSPDSQRLELSNGSGVRGQSPQHSPDPTRTVAYENAIFFKGKAKAAAPPVARKPKHTSTSSPGPAFNRREHSGPPTTPKPKRN